MFDTKQLRPRVDKGFVYELEHRAKPRGNSLRTNGYFPRNHYTIRFQWNGFCGWFLSVKIMYSINIKYYAIEPPIGYRASRQMASTGI